MNNNKIISAQLENLHAGVHLSAFMSMASSYICFLVLNDYSPNQAITYVVVIVLWLSYLIRLIDARQFNKKDKLNVDINKCLQRFIILSTVSALAWSALLVLLLPQQDNFQALTVLIVLGVGAIGITGLAYNYTVTVSFLTLIFGPMIVKLYLLGTDFSQTLLLFTAIFYIFLLVSAKKFNRLFLSQIQTSIKHDINDKTLEDLRFAINRHAMVSISDGDGKITYINDNFNNISQYTSDEVIGNTHQFLNSGYHPDSFFKDMWQALTKGQIWRGEIRNKAKDGSFYWTAASIIPFMDSSGKPEQYISIRNDITELKNLERQQNINRNIARIRAEIYHSLQTQEPLKDRFQQVLAILNDFVGLDTQHKSAIFLNQDDYLQLFVTSNELSDHFMIEESCMDDGLCDSVAKTGKLEVTSLCLSDEGNSKNMSLHGHYVVPLIYSGEVLGVLFLYTDPHPATEKERLERLSSIGAMLGLAIANERAQLALESERAIAVKANKAKSEFLSSISHELRTPLNAILGFAQLLETDSNDPLSTEQQESISYITNSGKHLLSLINQVLELSSIEAGKVDISIEPLDLDHLIEECTILVNNNAEKNNIDLLATAENNDLFVFADLTKLKQVLLNLLSNAIKYNREGGSVTISKTLGSNNTVKVSIRDTGIGVSIDNQKKLFRAFERLGQQHSEIEGTGIGLLVCKDLIELMGGNIGFDSIEGQGTTFWFELPLAEKTCDINDIALLEQTSEIEVVDSPENDDNKVKDILYVEDNPANRRLMTSFFDRQKTMNLYTAETGELGVEMVKSQPFDLVLMDINLPGIDGREVTQIIRDDEKLKHLPVIAVTANAMKHDVEGSELLFDAYLTKPIEFDRLLRTINKNLEKK